MRLLSWPLEAWLDKTWRSRDMHEVKWRRDAR